VVVLHQLDYVLGGRLLLLRSSLTQREVARAGARPGVDGFRLPE